MKKLTPDEIRKMAEGTRGAVYNRAVYEGPRRRFGGSSAFEPQKMNAISSPVDGMSERMTALDPLILDRWLKEAKERPVHLKGDLAVQRLRVEILVAEVRRLRGLVECIATVACSEAFRKLSQQGYGDIEELCEKALGAGACDETRLLGLMHDAVLEKLCPQCQKANFACECGEEES